jgi:hypothetical protein
LFPYCGGRCYKKYKPIVLEYSFRAGHFLRDCNCWGQVSTRAFTPHS